MDRNILITILKDEGYPTHMVDKTIEKLERLQPEISIAFSSWLTNGKNPDISVHGYSFNNLTNDYEMKPVGAFITLDWLEREPEKAKTALERGFK